MRLDILTVRELVWADFIELDYHESSVYYAHIFWNISWTSEYRDGRELLKTLSVKVSPKSWVVKSLKEPALLAHEAGHYAIGCLCALQFLKEVNLGRCCETPEQVAARFGQLLKRWLAVEKQYDDETEHYLNAPKQLQWSRSLESQLYAYMDIFDCALPANE